MNYTQNEKIEQVKETTLVLGVDIGSSEHYVRAFDWRGKELTKKAFKVTVNQNGFLFFAEWVKQICSKHDKKEVLIGCEPTGHYWYTFEQYIKSQGMKLVFVNPASVKKAKELDDNSPNKSDLKDPRTIGKLIIDGRYCYPYVPEDIYSDLREAVYGRDRIQKELNGTVNRIQRWLKIYFPEYTEIYKVFESKSGMMILAEAPLPEDIRKLGVEGIVKIWRQHKVRGRGASLDRAKTLVEAAHNSIGKRGGIGTRTDFQLLLEDYYYKKNQLDKITSVVEELTMQIPNAKKLLDIKGVGVITVAGFFSEVGDISRFKDPKQIQKYAGLELVKNSSGKHKGKTKISKRGRKRLRKILFQVILPLIRSNPEFREIYNYYTTRVRNPLKGRQAMIALSCKLIRVFFAMIKNGASYNPEKMLSDIHRQESFIAA